MAFSIVFGAVLLFSAFVAAEDHLQPLSDEFIDLVQNSWTADQNLPEDTSIPNHMLVGALWDDLSTLTVKEHDSELIASLPETFDPRTKWPNCPSINEIRNQACCGSCWAFGAAEAMTDRVCIFSNGSVHFHFSAEDLLSCCSSCSLSCSEGGYPSRAWEYWASDGIVSGGAYGSSEGCMPYEIPNPPCQSQQPVPPCTARCQNGYKYTYSQDKHYGNHAYAIHGEENIKAELYQNGPVEAIFNVYEDFKHYTPNSVYSHKSGPLLGGHAVKMLGWGVKDGMKYWLLANSWGTTWGDQGFFKILRGHNECNIEKSCFAGIPK